MSNLLEKVKGKKISNLISSLLNTEEKKQTKIIQLKYESCCGCGCDTYDVRREVSVDSELKEGQFVTAMKKGDLYAYEGDDNYTPWS